MPTLDDLESPAVSVLLHMLDEEDALNMRRFVAGCQATPARARKTLATLERLGIVKVKRLDQGTLQVSTISLTPLGRDVAGHLAAANRLVERGRGKRPG